MSLNWLSQFRGQLHTRRSALSLLGIGLNTYPQQVAFSIPYYTVGEIVDLGRNAYIGSGFVFENMKTIVTAHHVAVDLSTNVPRRIAFVPVRGIGSNESAKIIPLEHSRALQKEDIAILTTKVVAVPWRQPLKRGDASRVLVGSNVGFGGFDRRKTGAQRVTFTISGEPVTRVYQEAGLKYFRMSGAAIPGFSGGPVFGLGDSVVGVILRGEPRNDSSGSVWFDAISIDHVPVTTR